MFYQQTRAQFQMAVLTSIVLMAEHVQDTMTIVLHVDVTLITKEIVVNMVRNSVFLSYLGYVHPKLNVTLLMFFPSTPIFCLSCLCHTNKNFHIIAPSSFLTASPPFFPSVSLAAILLMSL